MATLGRQTKFSCRRLNFASCRRLNFAKHTNGDLRQTRFKNMNHYETARSEKNESKKEMLLTFSRWSKRGSNHGVGKCKNKNMITSFNFNSYFLKDGIKKTHTQNTSSTFTFCKETKKLIIFYLFHFDDHLVSLWDR